MYLRSDLQGHCGGFQVLLGAYEVDVRGSWKIGGIRTVLVNIAVACRQCCVYHQNIRNLLTKTMFLLVCGGFVRHWATRLVHLGGRLEGMMGILGLMLYPSRLMLGVLRFDNPLLGDVGRRPRPLPRVWG